MNKPPFTLLMFKIKHFNQKIGLKKRVARKRYLLNSGQKVVTLLGFIMKIMRVSPKGKSIGQMPPFAFNIAFLSLQYKSGKKKPPKSSS